MTLEESAKVLVEEMGECWHEKGQIVDFIHTDMSWCRICPICNKEIWWQEIGTVNPDPSSWEFFGKAWEWAKKQEWWKLFWKHIWKKYRDENSLTNDWSKEFWEYKFSLIGPKLITELAEFVRVWG
jgi:hypothetical protein